MHAVPFSLFGFSSTYFESALPSTVSSLRGGLQAHVLHARDLHVDAEKAKEKGAKAGHAMQTAAEQAMLVREPNGHIK